MFYFRLFLDYDAVVMNVSGVCFVDVLVYPYVLCVAALEAFYIKMESGIT
jgi:hypothetical protein